MQSKMKQLILTFLLLFSVNSYAVKISSSCLMENAGMSRYDLNFDTQTEKGTIRYRFLKQDSMYDAIITEKSISQIKGFTILSSTNTDLSSGDSFVEGRFNFVYDHDKKLLMVYSSSIEINIKGNCT